MKRCRVVSWLGLRLGIFMVQAGCLRVRFRVGSVDLGLLPQLISLWICSPPRTFGRGARNRLLSGRSLVPEIRFCSSPRSLWAVGGPKNEIPLELVFDLRQDRVGHNYAQCPRLWPPSVLSWARNWARSHGWLVFF